MAGRCMTSSRAWQLSTNANTSGPGWPAVRNLTVTTTNRTVYGYELCFEVRPRATYTPQLTGSTKSHCTVLHRTASACAAAWPRLAKWRPLSRANFIVRRPFHGTPSSDHLHHSCLPPLLQDRPTPSACCSAPCSCGGRRTPLLWGPPLCRPPPALSHPSPSWGPAASTPPDAPTWGTLLR